MLTDRQTDMLVTIHCPTRTSNNLDMGVLDRYFRIKFTISAVLSDSVITLFYTGCASQLNCSLFSSGPATGRLGSVWCTTGIARQHIFRSILETSSPTRPRMSRVSGASGDFPVQLATRLPDWSAGGLLWCIVLPVCPCVVSFSKVHEHDTHDLLRTSR